MFKKGAVSLLSFMSVIFLISVSCYSQYPGPNKCTTCHALDSIYQEWLASSHAESDGEGGFKAVCFDCHVPGCFQSPLLTAGEKKGFQVLGYLTDDNDDDDMSNDIWVRLEPKDVCLRCHGNAHYSENNCNNCHMLVDGLTTYRVHKLQKDSEGKKIIKFDDDDENMDNNGMYNNIARYVTRGHKVHTFDPNTVNIEALAMILPSLSVGQDGKDNKNCFINAIGFDLR